MNSTITMTLRGVVNSTVRFIGKHNVSFVLKQLAFLTRKAAFSSHQLQMMFDWKTEPQPEWFDHYCDQYFLFRKTGYSHWLERGVYGLLAIPQGANVLELCCGDGFNAFHFYSQRAGKLLSVDFDKQAIQHAKRYNAGENICFELKDIRYNFPEGQYDNIIWDAAIEHFTEEEIDAILSKIKSSLKPQGILTGFTIVERADGRKQLSHHEREFRSKEDLLSFFKPHFANVKVFETKYPNRHNLYFYASQSVLPFDDNWAYMCKHLNNPNVNS